MEIKGKFLIFENSEELYFLIENVKRKIMKEININDNEIKKYRKEQDSFYKEYGTEEEREFWEERVLDKIERSNYIYEYAYCIYKFIKEYEDKVIRGNTDEDILMKKILKQLDELYDNKKYDEFIKYFVENRSFIYEMLFNSMIDDDDYIYLAYCIDNNNEEIFG